MSSNPQFTAYRDALPWYWNDQQERPTSQELLARADQEVREAYAALLRADRLYREVNFQRHVLNDPLAQQAAGMSFCLIPVLRELLAVTPVAINDTINDKGEV